MKTGRGTFRLIAFFTTACLILASNSVWALTAGVDGKIQEELKRKKDHISEIRQSAEYYRQQIAAKEREQATLSNQLSILGNKISASELDIQATGQEIEGLTGQIVTLDQEIVQKNEIIAVKKKLLASLVRSLRTNDETSYLEVLLNNNNFSDFFDRVERLQDVETRLHDVVVELKKARQDMSDRKSQAENRRVELDAKKAELVALKNRYEQDRGAKEALVQAVADSERRFQELLVNIKQEELSTEKQIQKLEKELQKQLERIDDVPGGGTLLSWPVIGRRITTRFHDPGYPFRHLFEHSGLDIGVPRWTPVKVASPGYVASARAGSQYGNYVVVVHSGGISTLYAHLSKINVKVGNYVSRGEIIGLSGGVPGTPGAGLSTGAHLHFETRVNGMPQNPLNYLVER